MSNDHAHLHLITGDDGRSFLLDIERDRILHLNAVGAEIWKLLSEGVREPEIVTRISRKYRVDEERVGPDVRALLKRIAELDLKPANSVASNPSEPKPNENKVVSYPWYGGSRTERPQAPALTILAAVVVLAVFDLILWACSLERLCSCVRAWPRWKRDPTDPEISGRVCSAVESACVWYPKRAVCLQRSAVTACLLKSYGIQARMKIGMRAMPFLAHAWVEIEQRVVNDWPGVKNYYQSLITLAIIQ